MVILISTFFLLSTITMAAISTDQTPTATTNLLRTVASTNQKENPKPLSTGEIRFDDGTTTYVICDPTPGHTWEGAIRATPEETAPYDGWALTTVGFFHSYGSGEQFEEHDGKVKIYDQGTQTQPGPLLNNPDDDAFHVDVQDWFEITLSQPITIDGDKDIWISIETTTGPLGTHYFGTDNAPTVLLKGDWFKYQGQWQQLHSLIQDDCNWNLYGIVEEVGALSCDAGGPYEGEIGENIQFSGSATGGTPPYSWYWDFGDGNTSEEQNPVHSYNVEGTFMVNLTVTDDNQDMAWDETTATISDSSGEPELEIDSITGGLGIKIVVKNTGDAIATNCIVDVDIQGGLFVIQRTRDYAIGDIAPGNSTNVPVSIFGIGLGFLTELPTIAIDVSCAEEKETNATVNARIFFAFVLIQ